MSSGDVIWWCTVLKTGAETRRQKSHAHFDWVSIWGLLDKEFFVISPIDKVVKSWLEYLDFEIGSKRTPKFFIFSKWGQEANPMGFDDSNSIETFPFLFLPQA